MSKATRVLWVTGLSGAGKSTLAREVVSLWRAQGEPVFLLDGDEIREVLDADAGTGENHDREARLALARKYSMLSRVLSAQGITVVVATISLFREVHEWNRKHLPNYFEIYLRVSLEELQRRDPKGIYQKFKNGEIQNVAGLDLPIDEPVRPDLIIEWDAKRSVQSLASQILERVNVYNEN
jgi:adenylylsulfate kinase